MGSGTGRTETLAQLLLRATDAWFRTAAVFEPVWFEFWESRGLTSAQCRVLYALLQSEPRTIGQVAEMLGRRPAVATGIVDRLSRQGFVLRRASARDRRMVEVWLTDAGRGIFRGMAAAVESLMAAILGRVPEAQAVALVELLETFVAAARDLPADSDPRN